MYYIVESPKVLNLPINDITQVKFIKANRNNMFICAITSNDIMIWYTTASTMIAFHQRADNSVSIHGENYLVEWKQDSSKIVVMTSKGYLIYFKVFFENEYVINDLSYSQNNDYSVFSNKVEYQNPLLGCKITYEFSVHIQSAFKSFFCFNDEIFVPLLNGNVIKVPWNDRTRADHFFFLLQKIYFKFDTESDLFRLKENLYITEFEMISLDESSIGIAAVLSDFSAIYLFFDNSNLFRGLIANNSYQNKIILHRCVAVNQLFKIVAFGCKNGFAVAYDLPEDYTTLRLSHFFKQESKDYETTNVVNLKWSPDYRCLCVLYDRGHFSIFSVFGSLLYDSKDLLYFYCSNQNFNVVKTLEFGIEGYSLWVYLQNTEVGSVGDIVKLKILKSSLINNSSMSNIEHISLNGEKEVYVCLNLTKTDSFYDYKMIYESIRKANGKKLPPKYQYPSQKLGGNSMWQILNLPSTYISSNYPIKMSSIDPEGKYLAVAGQRGFTHFSFINQKWKIFGNADQEKDIRITGGLLWWKEFICMSCFNFIDQRYEIRFYSRNSNLDNSYSKISKVNSSILQMNIFKNLLIIFGIDCTIQVIGLEGGKDSTSKIILNKLIEIPIHNYILSNPYLVICISLCPLFVGHFDENLKKNVESINSSMKSILVNVGGNLLMFQPDLDSLTSIPEDLKKTKPYSSLPPILISSNVENFWIVCNQNNIRLININLNFSLWLNCGFNGLKVWLPLSGDEENVQQENRIILTFPLKFYPLGLLTNQSLLIGANSEIVCLNKNIAHNQIQKATQLFMSFILEGLIKKGLDTDAKKLANGYRYLPYFLHILELLVHKISEEEATSSNSTSEKLLPKVVDFIKQFPEYLKIISHCTRKSEAAFWPYLFSIVGNPRLLFDQCLAQNDLETAASYLVVLQNTESLKPCENFSNMLLKAALKNCEWDLIREIIRFLSAIDPSDFENDVFDFNSSTNNGNIPSFVSPTKQTVSRNNSSALQSPNNSISKEDSVNKDESLNNSNLSSKSKLIAKKSFTSQDCEINRKSIESTIYEYANELIKSYKIKKLFEMFANLNYFNIYKWLCQFQSIDLVENFVQGLSSLHYDFNWPYPILINTQHRKTNSFFNESFNNFSNNENKDVYLKYKNGNEENLEKNEFDFELVAQELANTGSAQSEKELGFLIETFIMAKCYEWVFLLGLILRKVNVINDIIRKINRSEIPVNIDKSIRQGIRDLDLWSKNECCGYRSIIKKINIVND